MKRMIALLLVVLVCISVAGCSLFGGDKKSATPDSDTSSASSSSTKSSVSSISSVSKYGSIADYLEDEEVKAAINSALDEDYSNIFSDMKVYAEDNTLVYDYTFVETYDDDAAASMKESIDGKSDDDFGFASVIDTLRTHVDVENPQIKVIYRNGDGSIITSRVFT